MTFEDLFMKARVRGLNLSVGIFLEEETKDFDVRYLVEGFRGENLTGNMRLSEGDAVDEKSLFAGVPETIWVTIDKELNLKTSKALIP